MYVGDWFRCKTMGKGIFSWPSREISRLDLWMEMVPIRVLVGRPGPPPSLDLKPSEFDPLENYWTGFPVEGSEITFPRPNCEFR